MSHVCVTKDQIVQIIHNFNTNKAHGCDGISVAMLKLCAVEVSVPLQIIFNYCIRFAMFPDSWKYSNMQPVHKKENRQFKTNYRPISLLPIYGKILEKIVFDQVYGFLNVNNLLSRKPYWFYAWWFNYLSTSFYHVEYLWFIEKYDEIRATLWTILKRLIRHGTMEKVLNYLLNFFSKLSVNSVSARILNGKESEWKNFQAGVPQGSVLGPLLFLISST